MDGCHSDEESARGAAERLTKKHEGSIWLVAALDRDQAHKTQGTWFPTDQMFHADFFDRKGFKERMLEA